MSRSKPIVRSLVVGALLFGACGGDDGPAATGGKPPEPPADTAGTSSTTTAMVTTDGMETSAAPTTGEPGCCSGAFGALDCSSCDGQFCTATRTIGVTPAAEDYSCEAACVPTDVAGLVCSTDASCCDAAATCDLQTGYCRGPVAPTSGGSTSTSSGTGTGTDTDTDTDTDGSGTDTGSTTDAGTTGTTTAE